jgi:hypothetical protein
LEYVEKDVLTDNLRMININEYLPEFDYFDSFDEKIIQYLYDVLYAGDI